MFLFSQILILYFFFEQAKIVAEKLTDKRETKKKCEKSEEKSLSKSDHKSTVIRSLLVKSFAITL